MIAAAKPTPTGGVPDWHEGFLRLLPDIRRHAAFALRCLRPEAKEDAIEEVIASAAVAYARLAELGKKREAALRKEDEKLLKQIEQAEKQAIGEYEARVQRLLNSAMSASKQPYGASGKRDQQGGPTARTAPTAATKPKSPADEDNAPRRRRFKLWPFN